MHQVTIHNVSQELYESVRSRVLGNHEGKDLADGQEVIVSGIHAAYKYDAKAHALTVSVLSTPPVITSGYALGQLYDMLGGNALKAPSQV